MSVSELGPYHARSGIDRFLHPRRYGGPNYAAFDVANHFWEWCGGLQAPKALWWSPHFLV